MILSFANKKSLVEVELPASKSISHRILLIQALCYTKFSITNISKANDTILLQKLLDEVGAKTSPLHLDCEDAGTPFRFLTAFLCLQVGKVFELFGDERLHERPINDLVEALKSMGAKIEYIDQEGFAPLRIYGKNVKGGNISIRSDISSQFISALCLIAPVLENGLTIQLERKLVSSPYIKMTLACMKSFGIQSSIIENKIHIPHQIYQAQNYKIESDWSSACFFYAMMMMSEELECTMHGLFNNSLQGDAAIQQIAIDFGIETNFLHDKCFIKRIKAFAPSFKKHYDLSETPDLAIPFIVACAVKYPEVSISGVYHLEWKESKRITALQSELKKINILLHYDNDILTFEHLAQIALPEIISFNTYNDHRIAMALSMLTVQGYTIELDNSNCVKKSFPNYFEEVSKIGINHQ
ncbi:MAG: 3-phosphoshikimate 1-carboxyvinyltransferase [Bacteroidetes bacterium]|nr:3-phosphoshikimate 1-carboxyvinyltransferase [Bacteroidota bacterium]